MHRNDTVQNARYTKMNTLLYLLHQYNSFSISSSNERDFVKLDYQVEKNHLTIIQKYSFEGCKPLEYRLILEIKNNELTTAFSSEFIDDKENFYHADYPYIKIPAERNDFVQWEYQFNSDVWVKCTASYVLFEHNGKRCNPLLIERLIDDKGKKNLVSEYYMPLGGIYLLRVGNREFYFNSFTMN